VRGALSRQADAALAEACRVSGKGQDDILRTLLLLIHVDERDRPVRRRVLRERISAGDWTILEPFVAKRLLSTDTYDDQSIVGIAHEAFFREWKPLALAVNEASSILKLRHSIERESVAWDRSGRPMSSLWQRNRLREIRETLSVSGWPSIYSRLDLSPLAGEFLRASTGQERFRRLRATTVLATLLVVASVAAGVAIVQRQSALAEGRLAVSRGLIQAAYALRDSRPLDSSLLPIVAFRMAPTVEARSALLSAQATHYASTLSRRDAGAVHAVAFDRDGRILATATHNGGVSLWSIPSREFAGELQHSKPVYTVAVSPDGGTLASAGQDGVIRLWGRQSHVRIAELPSRGEPINSVAFSADGRLLASAGDSGVVDLWDARTFTKAGSLGTRADPTNDLSFSPDSRVLATASADTTIQLWDVAARTQLAVLRGHTGPVRSVEFSPDGRRLASGGDDRSVQVWNVVSHRRIATFSGHLGPVRALAFRRDSRVLASGDDGSVRVWDIATRTLMTPLTGPAGSVLGLAFSPDGRTLAGAGADAVVGFWNVSGLADSDQSILVNAVRFGPAGTGLLATASANRTVNVWSTKPLSFMTAFAGTREDTPPTSPPGSMHVPFGIGFSPDGQMIAVPAATNSATVWDLQTRRQVPPQLGEHRQPVSAVEYSPRDPWIVTSSLDGTIKLWNVRTHRLVKTYSNRLSAVNSLVFNSDGSILAAGSDDGAVTILNIDTGQRKNVGRQFGPVEAVAFSPDGRFLAAGGYDHTVRVWDSRTYRLVATMEGHAGPVVAVSVSPDSAVLASASTDGTVRLWNMRSQDLIAAITARTAVTSVAFSPDGETIATTDADGTAFIWHTDPVNAMELLCSTHPTLTAQVWSDHLPGRPYRPVCP
jgi:WD40 repeat protein